MKNPYEKYILAEMGTLGLAAILTLFGLFRSYPILILLSLVLLALSLVLSAMSISFTSHHTQALKQYIRAGLLIFSCICLLFYIF
ncbi:hypothetical protein P5G51_003035 [Virgibacillus sp. 179-BFC.A HS]|uniref:Uncharacterized protein n=1 Tax=Tigheibacillus jepli TaxID=3035914 RepID=A0ABU5CF81_9BACI|nr:hypothetical protein [Virgibacillus sp. 179-BFC.A HS]MDY0404517.1 hypothetical protein [Virgibacillus sp. 179-BFC.A HS]